MNGAHSIIAERMAIMGFDAVRRLIENDRFAADAGREASRYWRRVCEGIGGHNAASLQRGRDGSGRRDLHARRPRLCGGGQLPRRRVVAINVSITFVKSVSSGTIYAEAREISTKREACLLHRTRDRRSGRASGRIPGPRLPEEGAGGGYRRKMNDPEAELRGI